MEAAAGRVYVWGQEEATPERRSEWSGDFFSQEIQPMIVEFVGINVSRVHAAAN